MASPPAATQPTLFFRASDLSTIFPFVRYEANTELRTNLRRYASLSFIFFFPLALCVMISYYTVVDAAYLLSSLTLTVALTLTAILSVLGVTLITFTIVHDATVPPCKTLDRITTAVVKQALCRFFLPVLVTIAAGILQVAVISLPLAALMKLCVVKFLGSPQIHLVAVSYIAVIVSVGITTVFLVPNWGLAVAVTVAEETWGFESLRRSNQVLRLTMRQHDARLIFWECVLNVFRFVVLPIRTICSVSNSGVLLLLDGPVWALVMVAALETICYNTVATTLLYICCTLNPKIVAGVPVPHVDIGNIDPSQVIHVRE